MTQTKNNPETPKNPRKPRVPKAKQSATTLGLKQTARIAGKRAVKDIVGSKISNPLIKVATIAALGAIISYFVNKK